MAANEDLEKTIEKRIRKALSALGWHTEKIHGGMFQKGLPDLLCFHPKHGYRWIEVKRPKSGRLTRAQKKKFPVLAASGQGIWILVDSTDSELQKIYHAPNWRRWMPRVDKSKQLDEMLNQLAVSR